MKEESSLIFCMACLHHVLRLHTYELTISFFVHLSIKVPYLSSLGRALITTLLRLSVYSSFLFFRPFLLYCPYFSSPEILLPYLLLLLIYFNQKKYGPSLFSPFFHFFLLLHRLNFHLLSNYFLLPIHVLNFVFFIFFSFLPDFFSFVFFSSSAFSQSFYLFFLRSLPFFPSFYMLFSSYSCCGWLYISSSSPYISFFIFSYIWFCRDSIS